MITQEYFDEVCLENIETFGFENDQDAIKETMEQIEMQQGKQENLRHLTLTVPNTALGIQIRKERQQFLTLFKEELLAQVKEPSSAADLQSIEEALRSVHEYTNRDAMYRFLFLAESGVRHYLTIWSQSNEHDGVVIQWIVRTLVSIGKQEDVSSLFLKDLRQFMPLAMAAWLQTTHINKDLLQVAYWSCRHCESNKEAWIKATSGNGATLAQRLVRVLESSTSSASYECIPEAARLTSVLCTFDEFVSANPATVVQASHTSVAALAQEGAVAALYNILVSDKDLEVSTRAALFAALRSMAIQDDVARSMAALGVTDLVSDTFVAVAASENDEDSTANNPQNLQIATAIVGLVRNLCANDDIKSNMCKNRQLIAALATVAEQHASVRSLQEHVCGTVAAMALREPRHAKLLVREANLHLVILKAMEQHLTSSPLQRQAALAIRNLAARSPELRDILLDAGAERALYKAAANHAAVQDEVYAALRDLGKEVRLLRVQQDEQGKVEVSHTAMFGERNPNFRPVYE